MASYISSPDPADHFVCTEQSQAHITQRALLTLSTFRSLALWLLIAISFGDIIEDG